MNLKFKIFVLLFLSKVAFGALEKDKTLHFAVGAATGGIGYAVAYEQTKSRSQSFWLGFAASVVVGLTKEMLDSQKPGGKFDHGDFFATALGGLSVTFSIDLGNRPKGRTVSLPKQIKTIQQYEPIPLEWQLKQSRYILSRVLRSKKILHQRGQVHQL